MTPLGRLLFATIVCAALSACAGTPAGPNLQAQRDAAATRMLRDIEVLASDEFGGRRPGTPGGERTVSYLISRMQAMGIQSGTNDPGSEWRAPVELVSTQPLDHTITVRTATRALTLPLRESAAYSLDSRVLIDGVEVIFIGDGSHEIDPEEMTGRIVVMTGSESDLAVRERIFEAHPAAILTVLPDEAALNTERARFERERLLLAGVESDRLNAFVTRDAFARALPAGEWDRLITKAALPEFRGQLMPNTIAIDVHSTRRRFTSANVIGLIPGTVRGAGAVLLMAHWDHFGECAPATPDPICNGAVDNASGLALMLELAARLKANGPHDRDIYLLATSAEEAGLLGAKAFVESPPVPLESIVAAFNFDSVAVAPAGGNFGFVGEGRTPLDAIVQEVVQKRGVELGNREFAQSYLKRHDGWVLLEAGVPSVLISTAFASEIVLGPYMATRYHSPTDEVGAIEMGGAVDDLLLHEELVTRLASTSADTSLSQ
ncbi:M20/M25/M40 family metallo-hydrolase [Erythrobacter sp. SCSIO 43205]|uniref:M20/M25/M40 family metallo-hydrolase n=1 Tax=Erythrobacter sp. SCSIO 43205 TaxID=2779361 RepID=UPI001CA91AB4|nr:M20/M25/M40 family metallo-hydrolase [Erythrobacter sp. SCSIO 43205]UAB77311.1 M20/M25/M40 family metallo-hydrolase [Erythrobacter sp. SCSIO 43205]